jgi:hypothetical protein
MSSNVFSVYISWYLDSAVFEWERWWGYADYKPH